MRMKVTLVLLSCLVLGLLGCSTAVLSSAEEAQTEALATVGSGEALSAERVVDEGNDVWNVAVRMPNGAELEVILFAETGVLFEIKDVAGPFDYDLTPLAGMSTYAEARARVLEASPGVIEAWEVKLVPEEDRYFYEFYVRDDGGQLYEIKHWADTGELIHFEAVTMMD